jgi:hypothetical protein
MPVRPRSPPPLPLEPVPHPRTPARMTRNNAPQYQKRFDILFPFVPYRIPPFIGIFLYTLHENFTTRSFPEKVIPRRGRRQEARGKPPEKDTVAKKWTIFRIFSSMLTASVKEKLAMGVLMSGSPSGEASKKTFVLKKTQTGRGHFREWVFQGRRR